MLVFFTTAADSVSPEGKLVPCRSVMCRVHSAPAGHLCFSSEPQAGYGPNAFWADVPEADIARYEYKDEFRPALRMFAFPEGFVHGLQLTKEPFETRTGRPWNRWVVPVLDKRAVRGATNRVGQWTLVWASSPTVVAARVYRKIDDAFLSVEVTATADYDPTTDYVVAEVHEEFLSEGPRGVKETWRMEHLGGTIPYWMAFPVLWQQWVWDREVVDSAARYLRRQFPTLSGLLSSALAKETKHNKSRMWRLYADEAAGLLTKRLHEPINLGKLSGHSWTAVAAMPLRIAMRTSQHLPGDPWIPEKPKPEFQHPDQAGRYLLANLYGIHPKQGPGVDHNPQDRPYAHSEGELIDRG